MQYPIYSAIWRKKIKKRITSLTTTDIAVKGSLNSTERKLLNIFSLNLLSKFYVENYPKVMNNIFINNVLRIINNLRIQITYYQFEVINYWRTIVLALSRNQKTILTTFIEPMPDCKAIAKIHNICIYYEGEKKKKVNKTKFEWINSKKSLPKLIKNFENTWAKYTLIIKGTLFFQTKALTIVDESINYANNKENPTIQSFPFSEIKKIIICSNSSYLELLNNKSYVVVMPYNDCELFQTYLMKIKHYLEKKNVSLIYSNGK